MVNITSEAFTAANGTLLTSLNGAFSTISGQSGVLAVSSNRIGVTSEKALAYFTHSANPTVADYSVSADVYFEAGALDSAQAGVLGRYSASALTGYRAILRHDGASMFLGLYSQVSGTTTQLGAFYPVTFAVGDTVNLRLQMQGSTISCYLNGSTTAAISETNTVHTAAGRGGVHVYINFSSGRKFQLDNYSLDTIEVADTTAPVLTSPIASAVGATTATGGVTTDTSGGVLYYLASANATEAAATVKGALSQTVIATGVQGVGLSGLIASTGYYLHFCHRDVAGNDSAVSTTAQFTTATPDTTPPSLTVPSGAATSATTASGTVSTNDGSGALYYRVTINPTETVLTIKSGSSKAVSASGGQSVTISGLVASTGYYLHFVHTDTSGNNSIVASSVQFTTDAAPIANCPTVVATNVHVKNLRTGAVLYTKGTTANETRPASLSKLMSAYVLLQSKSTSAALAQTTTITAADVVVGGSGGNLSAGDVISMLSLLFDMMLPSSNSAAMAVARVVGLELLGGSGTEAQSRARFVVEMNSCAAGLGMSSSTFVNPHGLEADPSNFSTPEDLNTLATWLYSNEILLSIWQNQTYNMPLTRGSPTTILITATNQMFSDAGVFGGKTGTNSTPSPTYNLFVLWRATNGNAIALTVVGSTSDANRYSDMRTLVAALPVDFPELGFPSADGVFVKIGGSYYMSDEVYIKIGGVYRNDEVGAFIKSSGSYVAIEGF